MTPEAREVVNAFWEIFMTPKAEQVVNAFLRGLRQKYVAGEHPGQEELEILEKLEMLVERMDKLKAKEKTYEEVLDLVEKHLYKDCRCGTGGKCSDCGAEDDHQTHKERA